jgi:roadblock/LC7 domain-containing protein
LADDSGPCSVFRFQFSVFSFEPDCLVGNRKPSFYLTFRVALKIDSYFLRRKFMKKLTTFRSRTILYSGLMGSLAVFVVSAAILLPDPVESKFKALSANPLPRRTLNEPALEREFNRRAGSKAAPGQDLSLDEMAYLVRQRVGQDINRVPTRFAMLESLIRDLQQRFPDRWVENLHQILGAAFPGREQELFKLSETIYQYQQYYRDNSERLNRMSQRERQAEVWKVRQELFGAQAPEIWAQEIKLRAASNLMNQIEADKSSSWSAKLETLRTGLAQALGDDYTSVLQSQREVFLERFLKAIQSSLAEMAPSERRAALWRIRQTMGLDENALRRWEALDAERDRRWEAGRNYLNERQTLLLQYSGQELEKRLDELRAKYLGAEAETIKSEEASGYYRYQKTRVWGAE